MKLKSTYALLLVLLFSITLLSGCAGMHIGGGIGLNFSSGPYGPSVTPSLNIGMYGGGMYW